MKKTGIALAVFLLPVLTWAQIPNPDLEQWKSVTREIPAQWTVFGNAVKVQGYNSPHAVKVIRSADQDDVPGAVVYGQADQGFKGGVPYSGRPDSFVGFFKTHIVPGDSAWVVAILKRGGQWISQNIWLTTGTDSAQFQRKAFALNYMDTGMADSVIVGFTSTHPEDTFHGSWVIGDSLHFTGNGTFPPLPNGGFEQWDQVTYMEPLGWATVNSRIPKGFAYTVERSSDHVYGAYSARIQNVFLGSGQYATGYIMAGRQGDDGPEPGFPVFGRDSVLYFNYKFYPQSTDSMSVGIIMYDSGEMVGAGFFFQGDTVSTWTEQAVQIGYFPLYAGIPDSAVIFCAAFQGGEDPAGESVLYIDGLKLNTPMNRVKEMATIRKPLQVFPNPASDEISVIYEIGKTGMADISVYNSNGLKVKTIFSGELNSGIYSGRADMSDLPPGLYFCRVVSAAGVSSGRVVVNR